MTDKEKIRKEVQRLMNELIQEKEKGYGLDVDDACILELQNVLTYIDSLQEESISENLEEASRNYADNEEYGDDVYFAIKAAFKEGAKWQKEHLWKPADGDELPEIDREVVAFQEIFPTDVDVPSLLKIVIAHRPNPEGYDGKSITTGQVEHYTPKTYDKGEWNIPDVKFWLDCDLPKNEE